MRSFTLWPVIIVLTALVAGLLTFTNTDNPARIAIDLWFLLVCPGMMLVRFLNFREPLVEWTLAVALSLVADTLVGSILLYTGRWSPTGAFAILLGFTVVGALAQEIYAFRAWAWRGRPQ